MISDRCAGQIGDNDVLSDWRESIQISVAELAPEDGSIQSQVSCTSRVVIQNVGELPLQFLDCWGDCRPQLRNCGGIDLLKFDFGPNERPGWRILDGADGNFVRSACANPQFDCLHLVSR